MYRLYINEKWVLERGVVGYCYIFGWGFGLGCFLVFFRTEFLALGRGNLVVAQGSELEVVLVT